MGKTAKDVMDKAISFLGVKESPANSNNVKFNTDYYGKPVNGSSYPWCCAYVWDVFRLANASQLFYDGKKTAYCPTVEAWGKQNKLTVDKAKGQYGDIVLFDFSGKGVAGHIGFIVGKNPDGIYKTIEGNTAVGNDANGGCVMYRNRSASSIRCIIRPKYEKAPATTTTTKITTKSGYTGTFPKIPTRGYFEKGDRGENVRYLQKFLNWYGNYKLTVDNICGAKTIEAVKKFQKAEGLTVDGQFGKNSLAKAKTVKK